MRDTKEITSIYNENTICLIWIKVIYFDNVKLVNKNTLPFIAFLFTKPCKTVKITFIVVALNTIL